MNDFFILRIRELENKKNREIPPIFFINLNY